MHSSYALRLKEFVLTFALFVVGAPGVHAQQTVFNVPSVDVLDQGQSYFEWDALVGDSSPSASLTPRTVRGIGHRIETGMNVSSFNLPDASTVSMIPTLKWKFYEDHRTGVAFIAGEDLVLPVSHRTFSIGNSNYVLGAKTFANGTRIAVGAYDFTAHVVDRANRAGVLASIEQTVNPRLSIAADWYSGNNSVGSVTPGVAYKATSTVTLFGAYELGNQGMLRGNRGIFLVLGWNPVWKQTPTVQ